MTQSGWLLRRVMLQPWVNIYSSGIHILTMSSGNCKKPLPWRKLNNFGSWTALEHLGDVRGSRAGRPTLTQPRSYNRLCTSPILKAKSELADFLGMNFMLKRLDTVLQRPVAWEHHRRLKWHILTSWGCPMWNMNEHDFSEFTSFITVYI